MALHIVIPIVGAALAAAAGYRAWDLYAPHGAGRGLSKAAFNKYVKDGPDTILNLPGHPLNGKKVPYATYWAAMKEAGDKENAAWIAAGSADGSLLRGTKEFADYPDGMFFKWQDTTPGIMTLSSSELLPSEKSKCIASVNVVEAGLSALGLTPGTTLVEITKAGPSSDTVAGLSLDPRVSPANRAREIVVPIKAMQGVMVV